jgi:predicted lipoprotein with Yx(FWY)xxD motif
MSHRTRPGLRANQSTVVVGLLLLSLLLLAACGRRSGAALAPAPAATPTAVAAPTKAPEPTKAVEPTKAPEPTKSAETAASQSMTETQSMTATQPMTETQMTTATEAMTGTTQPMGALVMLHEDAKLGKILVDAKGMTLYVFDKDEKDKSNCTGNCLINWPALTVKDEKEELTAGEGVTGKLGVIERDDGTYQVTIDGMPLYYYAKDAKAGDTTGQGVGDVWWVVGADGAKITTMAAATPQPGELVQFTVPV